MTKEAFDQIAEKLPADRPIFMVNLLRYRQNAEYNGPSAPPACSGREAYFTRYVPAFQRVVASEHIEGVRPFWLGNVLGGVVAPSDESWDDVAVVEYPTFAVFRQIVESPEYSAQAEPHRLASLADWRLLATTKVDLPG